jgi:hypothetical protein
MMHHDTWKNQGRPLAFAALAALLMAAPAQGQNITANRNCRKAIGSEMLGAVKQGMASQEACHTLANKACVQSDVCTDTGTFPFMVIDGAKYELKKGKVNTALQAHPTPGKEKCVAATVPESLANYAGGNVSDAAFGALDDLLASSSDTILGDEDLDCDKTLMNCLKAISASRRNVVAAMMNEINKCQAKVDNPPKPTPTPSTFGGLSTNDPNCLQPNLSKCKNNPGTLCTFDADCPPADSCGSAVQRSINTANATILKKCGTGPNGFTQGIIPGYPSGEAVGSCSPLPGCVVESAIAHARNAAHVIYPASNCDPVATAANRTVTATIDTPQTLSGVTMQIDYPHFQSGIPGNGDVSGSVTDLSDGSFFSAFDSDRSVTVVMVGDPDGYEAGDDLFSIAFDTCLDLNLATCSTTTTTSCAKTSDCPGGETCVPRTRVCSVSSHQQCGEPSDDPCPPGEFCVPQAAVTNCTVVDAVGSLGESVESVTCSLSITEP